MFISNIFHPRLCAGARARVTTLFSPKKKKGRVGRSGWGGCGCGVRCDRLGRAGKVRVNRIKRCT